MTSDGSRLGDLKLILIFLWLLVKLIKKELVKNTIKTTTNIASSLKKRYEMSSKINNASKKI